MAQTASPRWTAFDYSLLAASFVPAAIVTWGIHEFAHYLAGLSLGYEMWMTFNKAGPVQGSYDSVSDELIVGMAGPIVTWIQGCFAYWLLRRKPDLWIYSALFLAFWMRLMAMAISFIAHPNDEARASLLMGWPMWLIPLLSVAFLFTLTAIASRQLNVGWKGNLVSFVASSLVTTGIVFSDQILF